jgi:2-dehydro-3-deoxyphosphooctonate aldolase (KDO 8-P synthase)
MAATKTKKRVTVGKIEIGEKAPLVIIAGPCVIESHEHTLKLAHAIKKMVDEVGLPFIFKASYDKANRSSINSYRGPGIDAGLAILSDVHMSVGVPVTSDIHEPEQAELAGASLDMLQIPAFLCRQTDLLVAAAKTGRPVNIKKGQFVAPEDMRLAVEKVKESGGNGVLLTERGTFFGYGRLVNDMTALRRMAEFAPVVFDATHSCQLPGQGGTQSGGMREMVPVLARAGVAAGADALFLEVHENPDKAKSDPATVWPLAQLPKLLAECAKIAAAIRG